MVSVSFTYGEQEVLRLTVAYGQTVQAEGDASWLDFDNFRPYSQRLKRFVSWAEDCEEWTRALPGAYAGSSLQVRVLADTSGSVLVPPPVVPRSRRRQNRPKIAAILAAVLAIVVLIGVAAVLSGQLKPAPRRVPTPTLLLLPAGPATTVLLPKKVQPQQLTAAQVKALTTPLNSLVRVHNQWAASCVPLSGGRTITRQLRNCMLPGLTQMNTLVNQERTVVRSLEPSFALGPCRLALTGFDQQLYGFHLGLAQAAGGVSVADPNLLTLGLGTINSASTAVAASTKLTLPAACN